MMVVRESLKVAEKDDQLIRELRYWKKIFGAPLWNVRGDVTSWKTLHALV